MQTYETLKHSTGNANTMWCSSRTAGKRPWTGKPGGSWGQFFARLRGRGNAKSVRGRLMDDQLFASDIESCGCFCKHIAVGL